MKVKSVKFFGIKFYNENYTQIKNRLLQKGGYIVMPAASALSNAISKNTFYLKSLKNASVAIFDSSLFCLCLLLFKFLKVKKCAVFFNKIHFYLTFSLN